MESQDQKVRQELVIYKVVSARGMATREASRVERFVNMEKCIYTTETWEDFKNEIKRQFYPDDVAYLARKNIRRLKHTGSIHDYVNEFSSRMLEIPNMIEKKLLFNFMDNLQSHATSGGNEVSRDHNAPRMRSGKMPNIWE
ncbi:hypothetical protein CK203_091662 [Vitis vinifera]|uniref:Retrotransposon gag domain-containing protein n=1 Tax=Vitis vinifera TaxID=29760 RepID=A0A438FAX4_VITVI|nr:hypothetical protein CK203_091662 [Vitis vinifera]